MQEALRSLHQAYAGQIGSVAHLLLLLAAARIGTRSGWIWSCLLIGVISLVLWGLNLRRARAVADTATSRVASAPQGYVELVGSAKRYPGPALVAPISKRECVWYRYLVEEKSGDEWRTVDRGNSDASFLLEDGSGEALVDPDWAEVLTDRHKRWTDDRKRYTEWLLLPGDRLFVIGEFATVGGRDAQLDPAADVNDLLAQWKADKAGLKARFDLNGDGEIDLKEWELARNAARREVARRHDEIRTQPGVNMVRKPRDGRHFVISSLDPAALARRYRRWTLIQLVIAILAGAGALAAVSGRLA